MTLTEAQCRFTHNLALLILKANELGYAVKIVEVNRDIETQKRYVAEGKSKTMASKHLDKLAGDLALVKDGQVFTEGEVFRPLGEYWESIGGRWGGRFVDRAQFLARTGRDFDQSRDLGWDCAHFEGSLL